jgi:RNA polymerase sigma-70 factor (ECF subfamily)
MVARLRAGDDSALGAIYDQFRSLVNGIALRLVGPEPAAEITQDVFLQLWQRPDAFDPERGSLRTFLAVVARRRAIDELRRHGRREAREERVRSEETGAAPNVEEAALAMIAADNIRAAVERLPPPQRQAIRLAYFEGLTFRDVALATGSPEGTAKTRLRLGLGRLARDLAADAGAIEEPGCL